MPCIMVASFARYHITLGIQSLTSSLAALTARLDAEKMRDAVSDANDWHDKKAVCAFPPPWCGSTPLRPVATLSVAQTKAMAEKRLHSRTVPVHYEARNGAAISRRISLAESQVQWLGITNPPEISTKEESPRKFCSAQFRFSLLYLAQNEVRMPLCTCGGSGPKKDDICSSAIHFACALLCGLDFSCSFSLEIRNFVVPWIHRGGLLGWGYTQQAAQSSLSSTCCTHGLRF